MSVLSGDTTPTRSPVEAFDPDDLDGAYDAAAMALMRLIQRGYARHMTLRDICKELLRGPLADAAPEPGGYAMKAPDDPDLRKLGYLGSRLVEESYCTKDPVKAWAEARRLWERFSE